MLSYPSGMTVSSRALNLLADLLRGHRAARGTRWRKLAAGRQALLVVAHLRKNDTYAELACGFGVGTSTVYRYIQEGIELLAAKAPTLEQAIEVAKRKAFVTHCGSRRSRNGHGPATPRSTPCSIRAWGYSSARDGWAGRSTRSSATPAPRGPRS